MNDEFTKGLEIEIRREDAEFIDLMNDFEYNQTIFLIYQ